MSYYTGIGSRKTPDDVMERMTTLARDLSARYVLRSGHAPGADLAFERGAGYPAEIYLPWPNFGAEQPVVARTVVQRPSPAAFTLSAKHHPYWAGLSRGAKPLHARNAHQVLGEDLDSPSEFLVCWTPNGSRDGTARGVGGTGQALRIATAYGVPVYNLFNSEDEENLRAHLEKVCVALR